MQDSNIIHRSTISFYLDEIIAIMKKEEKRIEEYTIGELLAHENRTVALMTKMLVEEIKRAQAENKKVSIAHKKK